MKRFIEEVSRAQVSLLPECLDDFVAEDNPIRVVEAFVEQLDLVALEFDGVTPAVTGRPSYHPAVLLKVYIYGYLNRIQSSRRLECECQRNLELMWLTGRLAPDFKTIADFRRDNGKTIRNVCRQFVVLCRQLDLFSQSLVAIDGSKFKAVNNRDRNFTHGKLRARMEQIEKKHRPLSCSDGHRRPNSIRCRRSQGQSPPRQNRETPPARRWSSSYVKHRMGKSRSPTRMHAPWPPAAKAPA